MTMKEELAWIWNVYKEALSSKPRYKAIITFIISSLVGAILAIANIFIFLAMLFALCLYLYLEGPKEYKRNKPEDKKTEDKIFNPPA